MSRYPEDDYVPLRKFRQPWGDAPLPDPKPSEQQVGGSHYRSMAIQPIQFITANKLPYIEGCVIKYVCRHRQKNGAEDVRKAIHYLQLLLETEYGSEETPNPEAG